MIKFRLYSLSNNTTKVMYVVAYFSVGPINGYMIPLCLLPGVINLDHLVKVGPAKSLHCKVTVFSLGN